MPQRKKRSDKMRRKALANLSNQKQGRGKSRPKSPKPLLLRDTINEATTKKGNAELIAMLAHVLTRGKYGENHQITVNEEVTAPRYDLPKGVNRKNCTSASRYLVTYSFQVTFNNEPNNPHTFELQTAKSDGKERLLNWSQYFDSYEAYEENWNALYKSQSLKPFAKQSFQELLPTTQSIPFSTVIDSEEWKRLESNNELISFLENIAQMEDCTISTVTVPTSPRQIYVLKSATKQQNFVWEKVKTDRGDEYHLKNCLELYQSSLFTKRWDERPVAIPAKKWSKFRRESNLKPFLESIANSGKETIDKVKATQMTSMTTDTSSREIWTLETNKGPIVFVWKNVGNKQFQLLNWAELLPNCDRPTASSCIKNILENLKKAPSITTGLFSNSNKTKRSKQTTEEAVSLAQSARC